MSKFQIATISLIVSLIIGAYLKFDFCYLAFPRSSFHQIELIDIDRAAVPRDQDDDGQRNGRFRSRDGDNEDHEDLARDRL